MSLTTDPNDPDLKRGIDEGRQPQNKKYLILSEEELSKGFVRPVRTAYKHIGKYIGYYTPQPLTEEDAERYKDENYVAFIQYEESRRPALGKYMTQKDLDTYRNGYAGGCGTVTTMHSKLAETYARDPSFYGATYCCGCEKHLPVGEFVWDGTNETVGS